MDKYRGLYRGKREDNHEWVYGGIFIQEENDAKEYAVYILTSSLDCVCNAYEVYPDTVGECTGMFDKKGKLIFEDDIVILSEDVKRTFNVDDGEIRYGWGGFYVKEFSTLHSLNALASYDCVLRGEVIGNIHDNPELLEN